MRTTPMSAAAISHHRYNGLTIKAFARAAGVVEEKVRHCIDYRWFSQEGNQPDLANMARSGGTPQWSLSPNLIPKFHQMLLAESRLKARIASQLKWSRGVYVIRTMEGPVRYKIGFASDRQRRLYGLKSAAPVQVEMVAWIPGASMSFELRLHKVFRRQRLHGEWFNESPVLLWLIAKYRFSEKPE